ncbi:MAG: SDR family NAD(P)-dependent oxidoreductase, partial [Ferrovibrio sp.]
MRLSGKVAIITGGGSGFGEGIAKRFAAEGASVVIGDLNMAGAERVAAEINKAGQKALPVAADVSQNGQMKALVEKAVEAFGGLDIMVNNAGMPQRNASLLDTDEATFDKIFAV